jgi:hypothetical protein
MDESRLRDSGDMAGLSSVSARTATVPPDETKAPADRDSVSVCTILSEFEQREIELPGRDLFRGERCETLAVFGSPLLRLDKFADLDRQKIGDMMFFYIVIGAIKTHPVSVYTVAYRKPTTGARSLWRTSVHHPSTVHTIQSRNTG